MTTFFNFITSVITDGSRAFDVMDDVARVTDQTPLVRDVITGMNEANAIAHGTLDAFVHPAKKIINDLDLQAAWKWFKTILTDIALLLLIGLATLVILYLIG